jgi:hypothetical protein
MNRLGEAGHSPQAFSNSTIVFRFFTDYASKKGETMKKTLFWLPRIIVFIYPAIVILSTFIETFRFGFNLRAFLGLTSLAAVLTLLAYTAYKWPKIGAVIYIFVGILVLYNASHTSIGIDWGGLLAAGVPITIAGFLFLYEGYFSKVAK